MLNIKKVKKSENAGHSGCPTLQDPVDCSLPGSPVHGILQADSPVYMVASKVKNLPAVWETQVWSVCWEDPLEKWITNHSSILAWRIPWTEEPGGLQSMESHGKDQEPDFKPLYLSSPPDRGQSSGLITRKSFGSNPSPHHPCGSSLDLSPLDLISCLCELKGLGGLVSKNNL